MLKHNNTTIINIDLGLGDIEFCDYCLKVTCNITTIH